MAYTTQLGLGDALSDLISRGGPALQAGSKVISDPALPEIVCNVLRLNKVVAGKDAGPPCARKVYTIAQKRKGIGLHAGVGPLRTIVWARKNPAIAIGAGVGVVGLLVGLGYWMGKSK
jgi:hypothetical protein